LVAEVYDFAREDASLSAILTSSAKNRARIFRITWPRWTFTVASLIRNSAAILLVEAAGHDHHHHLALTRRQRIEVGTQSRKTSLIVAAGAVLCDRLLDCIQYSGR
jgi:hypothetical protein